MVHGLVNVVLNKAYDALKPGSRPSPAGKDAKGSQVSGRRAGRVGGELELKN